MSLVPLYAVPGICKVNSAYADGSQMGYGPGRVGKGRYTDMLNTRFVAGFPEKIGGYTAATSSTLTGVPRGFRDWRDNSSNVRLAIGTHLKLFYYSTAGLTDITPFRNILTGTLTNPFTTTNTSTTVTVAHTAHGLSTGDYVQLTTTTAVGGLTIAGLFNPITKVDANSYTIVSPSAATSGAGPGGGTVTYVYYRVTLSSPFTTTLNSKTVTVAHTSHGALTNDFVTIAGASAVGGITPSGEYQLTVVDANSYTIQNSVAASSGASGGGSPTFQYDINGGNKDSSSSFGYGTGGYGGPNGYGLAGTSSVTTPARVWSIWPYGQQIACNPSGGGVFIWDPVIGGRAYPLYNAPTQCQALLVTPERLIVEIGVNGIPMQIAWPDQSNNTVVASTPTNTANAGRTLQGGAYLVGGIPLRDGVSMIYSNTTAFTHTYTGDNNVYATNLVGSGCGLIGPLAVTEYGGVAYWMSDKEFFSWNGAVSPLPSDDIRDFVFNNINAAQTQKFWAQTIRSKKTIRFYYASSMSTEIDSYVDFHVDQNCWSIGSLSFTAGIDGTLFPFPMSGDANGNIYNMEVGTDANGSSLDAYFVVSPMDISNGDRSMDVMGFIPDMQRQSGSLSLSILLRDYPEDSDTIDGPYTVSANDITPLIDTRSSGKMAGYKIESNTLGGDYRVGICRADVSPAGARR